MFFWRGAFGYIAFQHHYFFHQLQFRFLAVRQKAKHPFAVCWNSGQNALRSHIYEAIESRIRSLKLSVWKLICGINERRGVLLWSEWAAGKTVEEEDYPLRITGNWDLELNLRICLTFLCLTITWWLQDDKLKRSLFFLFISLLLAFNNDFDGRYCHVTGKWAST